MAFLVSSAQNLPGLNFEAPQGLTDLSFVFDSVFSEEQRNRIQLLMGGYRSTGSSYGIVDGDNPNSATTGSSRPFAVSVNTSNVFLVDVNPGVAVTKSGNIIIVDSSVVGLSLVDSGAPASNSSYVVYAEYIVIGDEETNTLTKYSTVEPRRTMFAPVAQVVKVASLADYQNLSLFTSSRLTDIVVLAVVKVNTAGNALSVDHTNNVNAYNRPWFSPVDVEHRSQIGTGSADVPHRLGVNDMSSGNIPLYVQHLSHGLVLSKDFDVPGCPGKLNAELVSSPRVMTDSTGYVTGTVGQRYVRLLSFPLRLLACRSNDSAGVSDDGPQNDLAVSLLAGTNIILFPTTPNETFPTNGFTVYYTSSPAVEPPITVLTTDQITFGAPDPEREIYISGGSAYNTLPSPTIPVSDSGPFPKQYTVFIDRTQQLLRAPQIMVCTKYLETSTPYNGVGTAVQAPDFTMYGPAKITVGLSQLLPVPSVDASFGVSVQLIGTNAAGTLIQETVTFTALNYFPQAIPTLCGIGASPYAVNPKQYLTSSNTFSSLKSWQITSRTNDVPETVIMLWADIEPPTTKAMNSLLPLMTFRWSGQAVCTDFIRDARPVSHTLQRSEFVDRLTADTNSLVASMNVQSSLASSTRKAAVVAADDFDNPRWLDHLRSKRNRFSDGMQSYFVPHTVPAFGATFGTDVDTGMEFIYTRAILLPITANQEKLFLHLVSSLPEAKNTSSVQKVEYRLCVPSSEAWGVWTDAPKVNSSNLTRAVSLSGGPYLKVQFRFIVHDIRGFFSVMTGT